MENTAHREPTYFVVKNQEEQFSIWPNYKAIPTGWLAINTPASKAECLTQIQQQWTDMRPKSLR